MSCTIRVRVRSGMLEPLEPVELPEGQEVTVTILEVPSVPDMEAFRRSAGRWAGTFDAETLIRRIYEDRLLSTRSLPRL
jgi:predicted DNA-binding antitoxin AbrB/MazE fold protein